MNGTRIICFPLILFKIKIENYVNLKFQTNTYIIALKFD